MTLRLNENTPLLKCLVSSFSQQGASVTSAAGKVFVRRERRWQKRFPGRVSGQPETGAQQEQRNERKHQEVPGRGQKTGGVRRTETSPKEICKYSILSLLLFQINIWSEHSALSSQKTIESETVKTSEVLKKKLGNISETVKEVNVIDVAFRCSLNQE